MTGERGRSHERFRLAQDLARSFVNRDPPQAPAAAAIARKVQITTVGRPDRVPIDRLVRRYRLRVAAGGRNRVDVASALAALFEDGPIRDSVSVRRPRGLNAITREFVLLAGGNCKNPELRGSNAEEVRGKGVEDELLSVGRPRRRVAKLAHAANRFTGAAHDEHSTALPI